VKQLLQQTLDALEKIAMAGMSPAECMSEEEKTRWHAQRAWQFIGIAARALDPLRAAIAQPESEPVKMVTPYISQKQFDRVFPEKAQPEPVAYVPLSNELIDEINGRTQDIYDFALEIARAARGEKP